MLCFGLLVEVGATDWVDACFGFDFDFLILRLKLEALVKYKVRRVFVFRIWTEGGGEYELYHTTA